MAKTRTAGFHTVNDDGKDKYDFEKLYMGKIVIIMPPGINASSAGKVIGYDGNYAFLSPFLTNEYTEEGPFKSLNTGI